MNSPLHPNLIGVLSDVTKDRLNLISQVANEHSRDPASHYTLRRQLIAEDLGHPSQSETSMMHQASYIAVSTYQDWLKHGGWLTTLNNITEHDLGTGTHYLRLTEFHTVQVGSGEELHLEGAFVSGQDNSFGERDYAVTVLLSGDPGPRVAVMGLKELMQHQSNIVMTTWDAKDQRPVVAFSGRTEIADDPEVMIGIEKIWSTLAPYLGYGDFTPTTSQLKFG